MHEVSVDLAATADCIEAVQRPDGCIPHFPGGIADPWNHVEAAMGLDVVGRHAAAERAYRWLASVQRPDGAWAAAYLGGRIHDATLDANFVAYIAAGVWHHYLATGDEHFLEEMWAPVERAIGFVLGLQTQSGAIMWARDPGYKEWPGALLTSCACIHLSLRCAVAIGETVGEERPDWELSLASLADAIVNRPHGFEHKDRFSMDWYYPVLGGILTGASAHERLQESWDGFVVEGLGVRCVSDRPWITSGETAEMILALDVAGMTESAREMFGWLDHLRGDDGAYWIGATFPGNVVWPREKPTWASGAVILAADALERTSPTSGLFRGETFTIQSTVAEEEVSESALTDPL